MVGKLVDRIREEEMVATGQLDVLGVGEMLGQETSVRGAHVLVAGLMGDDYRLVHGSQHVSYVERERGPLHLDRRAHTYGVPPEVPPPLSELGIGGAARCHDLRYYPGGKSWRNAATDDT